MADEAAAEVLLTDGLFTAADADAGAAPVEGAPALAAEIEAPAAGTAATLFESGAVNR